MTQDLHRQAVERFEDARDAVRAISEILSYDADTGLFVLLKSGRGRGKVGSIVGSRNAAGYLAFNVCGVKLYAHRVAWLLAHGAWPLNMIDHLNGDKADNRIANLRDVPRALNVQNVVKPRRGNKAGLLGVAPTRSKWRAEIRRGEESKHLGVFDTPEEAHLAYCTAKKQLHQGWVR